MPLTETRLRALKPKDKPYKVADDRGLYIEVSPAGGKLWRFRYRIGPVEKKLSIGAYSEHKGGVAGSSLRNSLHEFMKGFVRRNRALVERATRCLR